MSKPDKPYMFSKFLISEKFFIAIIVIIIFLFNLIPHIYQSYNNPSDKTYVGSYPIVIDKPVYLAEMTQGTEGNWLFTYNYTTEFQKKTFIYSFYIFLGRIAAFLHLPLETAFFLSRFFFGLALIVLVIYFIRYFVKNKTQRKIAYIFAFFSSGLGFLTHNPMSLDLWIPDFMPMVRFSYFPHMVLANALLLAIILSFFHSLKTKNLKLAFLAGFLSFILNILLPYHNFIIYSIIVLFLLLNFIKNKSAFYSEYLKNGLIFFIVSLPSFLYMTYLGIFDPFWREVAKYNSLLTPPITEVLTGYGIILIFSICGLYSLLKKENSPISRRQDILINHNKNFYGPLFLFWIISTFILAYTPFIPMQRRVLEAGLFVPLAITASFGVVAIYNRLKTPNPRLACLKALLTALFIFPFMIFGNIMNLYAFIGYIHRIDDPRFYISNKNIEAMLWLRQNSFSDSIILSSYYNGNIIPYYADRMVYAGHGLMTIDFEGKMQKVENFYSGKYSTQEAGDFLRKEKIDYVFFSREEKEMSNAKFNPENFSFLKKCYKQNGVLIYKFLPTES